MSKKIISLNYFILLIIILLNFSAKPLFSLDPDKNISQYIHKSWEIKDGLPQNSVFSIIQSYNGYLWLATEEGIVRYNGNSFEVYNRYNVDEIKHNYFWCIIEDALNNLWFGSRGGGVIKYDFDSFFHIGKEDGLTDNFVLSILEDRIDGSLWIGTNGSGLNQYKDGNITQYTTKNGLINNFIGNIIQDEKGVIWIGTRNGINLLSGTDSMEAITTENGILNNTITELMIDKNKNIWVGTEGGINIIKDYEVTKQITIEDGLSSNTINCITQDSDSIIWIGTYGGGINRFINGQIEVYNTEDGMTDDIITSIYEDKENNLWIGTRGGGLNMFRNGKFTCITKKDGLSSNVILSIFEDSKNNLWIGTRSSGLDCYKDGNFKHFSKKDGLKSDMILAINEDINGNIWFGTYGGGLVRYDGKKFVSYTKDDGLTEDIIYSILNDDDGGLWFGTYGGGMNYFKDGKFTYYTTENGLSNNLVLDTTFDFEGNLWIGTNGGGLNVFKDGNFKHYNVDNFLSNNVISRVYEDKERIMWIGTVGGGLMKYHNGKFYSYSTKDGLFNDNVFWLLEDNNRNLWITCNKGIYKISIYDIFAYDRNEINSIPCENFGVKDGMKSSECNGGSSPAGWASKDKNGHVERLYFPTVKGVCYIDPDEINYNTVKPEVHIEKIKINNQSVSPEAKNVFSTNAKSFRFLFSACTFTFPEATKYRYILEGFDNDWIETNHQRRIATYTNLDPGNYIFRVTACNNDGYWAEKTVEYPFKIKPNFHQTEYFFILIAIGSTLLLIITAYMAIKIRHNMLLIKKKELEQKVEERTNELKIAKQKAERANRLKTKFLASISHDLKTPLNAIVGYSTLIKTEELEDNDVINFAERIYNSSQILLVMINDLLDISKIESNRIDISIEQIDIIDIVDEVKSLLSHIVEQKEIDFFVEIDKPSIPDEIYTDPNKLQRILFNLIGNAVKFTDDGFVRVKIYSKDKDTLSFEIRDSGIGIPEKNKDTIFEAFTPANYSVKKKYGGTGLGLAISKTFINLLGGKIWFESKEGEGTTFYFYISTTKDSSI